MWGKRLEIFPVSMGLNFQEPIETRQMSNKEKGKIDILVRSKIAPVRNKIPPNLISFL